MRKHFPILFLPLFLAGCLGPATPTPPPTLQPPTALPTSTTPPTETLRVTPTVTTSPISPSATPTLSNNQFNMKLVSQLGGGITSVALYKSWVFVGQGPRLVALDISDLNHIQAKAQSEVLPGLVKNFIIQDQTAYLTAGTTLVLLDLADLSNLKIKGQLELPGEGDLILRANTIYVAGRSSQDASQGYIATVDVSANPQLLKVINLPYVISSLALRQNLLYIAREQTGDLLTVDVSQPDQLAAPTPLITTSPALKLRIVGDTLIAAGYSDIEAFDLSDASHPTLQWQKEDHKLGQINDFTIQSNRLITSGLFGSEVYLPARAVVDLPGHNLGEADYLSPASLVSDSSGDILVLEDGSLNILYWVEGQNFQTLASYALSGGELGIDQDQLFVSEADRLTSYSLPDLTQLKQTFPVLAGSYSPLTSTLTVSDGDLYVSGEDGLYILNTSDLSRVGVIRYTPESSITPDQSWSGVSIPVANHIVYLHGSANNQEEIITFDVSDPAQPRQIETVPIDSDLRIKDIAATDNWLVVSLESSDAGWLAVYDLSSGIKGPLRTVQLAQPAADIQISQNTLLAGENASDENGSLQFYLLPNLTRLSEISLPEISAIGVSDSLAYVSAVRTGQVSAFDFSKPKAPKLLGTFEVASGAGNIAISGQNVVIGNRYMGLYVFQR
jgi:hypothetical protein